MFILSETCTNPQDSFIIFEYVAKIVNYSVIAKVFWGKFFHINAPDAALHRGRCVKKVSLYCKAQRAKFL